MCLFSFKDATQISDMRRSNMACFHLNNYLLRSAAFGSRFIVKINAAIYSLICAFLVVRSSTAYQINNPKLETIWIIFCKRHSSCQVSWLSNYFVCILNLFSVCVMQPSLDEIDCQVGNIDADPASFQFL